MVFPPSFNPLNPLHQSMNGVRILDCSRVLAGPFATQILGDLGAEVIKIEEPVAGDDTRSWGPPFVDGLASYFISCNRNKKSVALNLKKPAGRKALAALAACSDIVIENFLEPTRTVLGINPQQLFAVNKNLVIISISAFGSASSMSAQPGYDFVVQGMSGLMAITGPVEGPPSKVGVAIVDVVTGLYATIAALAGLRARTQFGHGLAVNVSLLQSALATQVNVVQRYLDAGTNPPRIGNAHGQIVPYQAFESSDGWIIVCVGNQDQWTRFCKELGVLHLVQDSRFLNNTARVTHRKDLIALLAPLFRAKTTTQWCEALARSGVPGGPVWSYDELFKNFSSAAELTMTATAPDGRELKLVGSPLVFGTPATHPPALGADTKEVLSRLLNYSNEEIEDSQK